MNKKKIYIASPYTIGDVAKNVKLQLDAGDILFNLGVIPFIPLWSHYQHIVHPRSYEEWMEYDFNWIESCDAILRIKPLDKNNKEIPSSGADREVQHALSLGIPVYYAQTLEDIKDIKF